MFIFLHKTQQMLPNICYYKVGERTVRFMKPKRIIVLLLLLSFVASLCCCTDKSGDSLSGNDIQSDDSEIGIAETDNDGCGLLSVPMDEYEGVPSLYFCEDTVFVQYTVSGLDSASVTVASYGIASGERLATLELNEGLWYIDACNGNLFVYDNETYNMCIYSRTLQLVNKYTLDGEDSFTVSGDGAYILFGGYEPKLYSVPDGVEKELNTGCIVSAVPYSQGFIIESDDNELYAFNVATGTLTYCGDRKKARPVTPYLVEEWDDGIIYGAVCTDKRYVLSQSDPSEYVVCAADGVFVTLADCVYRIYDLEKQAYTEMKIEGVSCGCAFYNGCFFVGCDDGIYVKDLSKSAFSSCAVKEADESTDIHGWYKPYEGDREEITTAKRILEKYGVRVIYESDRLKDGVFEYSYTPAESQDLIPVVFTLKNFLQTLPDGMISELTDGGEVWFYMCRNITKSSEALGGFASTVIDTPLVVVDSECRGEGLMSTIAHEFAHIFNYRLTASALDKWAEFTPSDHYGEATVQYTPYGTNKNDVWFVSAYARTNEEEDRAETFAAMYIYANYGKLTDVFEYENIFNKAALYAEILRECFSSCQNTENLYWEKVFE